MEHISTSFFAFKFPLGLKFVFAIREVPYDERTEGEGKDFSDLSLFPSEVNEFAGMLLPLCYLLCLPPPEKKI